MANPTLAVSVYKAVAVTGLFILILVRMRASLVRPGAGV